MFFLLGLVLAVSLVEGQWQDDCHNTNDCLYRNNLGLDNLHFYPNNGDERTDGALDWNANWFSTPQNGSWDYVLIPSNMTVAADDFIVPVGEKWTVRKMTFIGYEDTSWDWQVNRKAWWYFWENVPRIQNNTLVNQPEMIDQPFYRAKCDMGSSTPNMFFNSTTLFRRGTPCHAYTCVFQEPLVVDNRNGTEDKIVWHGWLKHHMWSLQTLYRWANYMSAYAGPVLTDPPMQGNYMNGWVGSNITGLRSFPFQYYTSSDLSLYNMWHTYMPNHTFGVLSPGPDTGYEADWPLIIQGDRELL